MKITKIKKHCGSYVEFDDPMEFFNYDIAYWRNFLYSEKLIIFKKMTFSKLDYAKFTHYFGYPWKAEDYKYSREITEIINDLDNKEYVISPFSNILNPIIDNKKMPWHADIPNRQVRPFPSRSLWMIKNPNPQISGKTSWLNIEDGINYLNDRLKDLSKRIKVKQQSWYKFGTDLQFHNFLKVHPITGKTSLRLNTYGKKSWIIETYIDDILQIDNSLIQEYIDYLTKFDDLICEHTWDDFDIALYDNYSFIHCRSPVIIGDFIDKERKFYRVNIDHLEPI